MIKRVGISGDKSSPRQSDILPMLNTSELYTDMMAVDLFTEQRLPLQERVVDKLADIMFASDMILDMLEHERKSAGHLSSVEPSVRRVYDQVNALGMFPKVDEGFRVPEMRFTDIPVRIDGERSSRRRMPLEPSALAAVTL